jgi:hypothetical protein
MEDYMNYLSALNETGGIMNQVASAREMVDQQVEEKKQEYGIPSEMIAETAGIYLGKKVLGMVAEKFGDQVANVASKVGISTETTGKLLSGDVEGAVQGAVEDIQANVGGLVSGAVEQATSAVSGGLGEGVAGAISGGLGEAVSGAVSGGLGEAVSGAVSGLIAEGSSALSGAFGGLVSNATGIVGELASNVSNVVANPINIEESANALYEGTMSDLASQAEMEAGALRNFGNVSMGSNVANDTSQVGDVELTDFSTVGSDVTGTAVASGTAVETGTAVAEVGATVGATAGAEAGAITGEAVAGGLEAVAGGLSATGILAPLAGILGLIGGLVGIFEEHKSAPAPFIPVLNPSSQDL